MGQTGRVHLGLGSTSKSDSNSGPSQIHGQGQIPGRVLNFAKEHCRVSSSLPRPRVIKYKMYI